MRVLVIGNGIAGINVAQALSAHRDIELTVVGEESSPFYSRVRLPEVLSGRAQPDDIIFYKPEWYEKKGFSVQTGCRVLSIDRNSHTAFLSDGRTLDWDRLVLATGASSNRPSVNGFNLPGVFTLRTLQDVQALRASVLQHPDSAAVIGGGLLGLEAARSLKDAGASSVRVFELFPRLLPRQLDETGASLLKARFEAMGIEIVLGAETDAILPAAGETGPRAGSLRLKDGRAFPADTVLLSMGVHSNTDLAGHAGLQTGRGIIVDSSMRTSDPSIFAAGDCAEFEGIVWGIIPAALEQAPVVAKTILSDAGLLSAESVSLYTQTVPKTALKVADIELLSTGKVVLTPEEEAAQHYRIISRVWQDGTRYEKFVVNNETGVLSGAIIYGSRTNQSAIQKLLGQKTDDEVLNSFLQ